MARFWPSAVMGGIWPLTGSTMIEVRGWPSTRISRLPGSVQNEL
jgi:hypothetical protein